MILPGQQTQSDRRPKGSRRPSKAWSPSVKSPSHCRLTSTGATLLIFVGMAFDATSRVMSSENELVESVRFEIGEGLWDAGGLGEVGEPVGLCSRRMWKLDFCNTQIKRVRTHRKSGYQLPSIGDGHHEGHRGWQRRAY